MNTVKSYDLDPEKKYSVAYYHYSVTDNTTVTFDDDINSTTQTGGRGNIDIPDGTDAITIDTEKSTTSSDFDIELQVRDDTKVLMTRKKYLFGILRIGKDVSNVNKENRNTNLK